MKNTKLIKNISFLFFGITILSSCEDFFDTTLEIDPPQYNKRISLISRAFAGDKEIYMNIRGSLAILDNAEFPLVEDLGVILFHNGDKINVLEDSTYSQYTGNMTIQYKAILNRPLQSGDVVEIKATGRGYPEVYVTDTVPLLPVVEEGKFKLEGGRNQEGEEVSKVTFFYQSHVNQTLYFVPKLFTKQIYCSLFIFENGESKCAQMDTIFSESRLDLDDPIAVRGTEGPLVKQTPDIVSKPYTCQVYRYAFGGGNNETEDALLEITNVSKAFYDYDHSIQTYNDNNDNPFSTPTNVRSNVRNGYGVLGLGNKVQINLIIE